MHVLCSSRKPMRKTPVSGFPSALLSLVVMHKRALDSRLYSTQVMMTARSNLSRDSNDVVLARKVFWEPIQHGGDLTVLLKLL